MVMDIMEKCKRRRLNHGSEGALSFKAEPVEAAAKIMSPFDR